MTIETTSLAEAVAESSGSETAAKQRAKPSIILTSHGAGMLWFAGWLFTTGFADLVWWRALLGLILWPYYLGDTVR